VPRLDRLATITARLTYGILFLCKADELLVAFLKFVESYRQVVPLLPQQLLLLNKQLLPPTRVGLCRIAEPEQHREDGEKCQECEHRQLQLRSRAASAESTKFILSI
jgi:hypothetical protein